MSQKNPSKGGQNGRHPTQGCSKDTNKEALEGGLTAPRLPPRGTGHPGLYILPLGFRGSAKHKQLALQCGPNLLRSLGEGWKARILA